MDREPESDSMQGAEQAAGDDPGEVRARLAATGLGDLPVEMAGERRRIGGERLR